ncbi:hypothetical protein M8C13_07605 [Crossiella sp. SN42]|uniref:nSTAND1 domain-containing NTPase n=1 Tax=Crossiella sp. SN42 TaxID=2944808 RepID=UPI00207D70A4|nr:hypothetical protein [Crossiella sp. SN42]MCO1575623.1 hypothetical protein [Crossiella sp. SN42]
MPLYSASTITATAPADTRHRIARSELDPRDPVLAVVLERLARARLITLDHNSVEIAHEALIRGCGPGSPTTAATCASTASSPRRPPPGCGTVAIPACSTAAPRLALARDRAARNNKLANAKEREFLRASAATEAQELDIARRRTRWLRRLVGLLTVTTLQRGRHRAR